MSKFYEIINNYPKYREISSANILNELFSGIENWVLTEKNTCAIRVSTALNESNLSIKRGVVNERHYIRGRGRKNKNEKYDYILRVTGMIEYLNKKYGRPVEEFVIDMKDYEKYRLFRYRIEKMSGIVALESRKGSNFTGHVDIWHKGKFLGNDYFGADWIKKIYFWVDYKFR